MSERQMPLHAVRAQVSRDPSVQRVRLPRRRAGPPGFSGAQPA